jgi:hypothetical protein
MALLYNNSNVNATATVFGGGTAATIGPDPAFSSISLTTSSVGGPTIRLITVSGTFGGQGGLYVDPDNNNGVHCNQIQIGTANTGICNFTTNSIAYKNAGTGVGTSFVTLNVPNTSAAGSIALTNIASINGAQPVQAGQVVFGGAATSTITLATPYSSVSSYVVTTGGTNAAGADPFVNITSASTFTIQASGAATVNWICSGKSQ